ncbi:MAG: UbiA family prenyltransferase [Bacteroidota bacterium]
MPKPAPKPSFLARFWTYLAERFPLQMNGVVIAVFTFSAISYSRICRGEEGFVAWDDYLLGFFVTLTIFFMVRIFDEFKDQKEDALYRQYLPVPRGLISLKELFWVGVVTVIAQFAVILLFHPTLLWLYLLAMGYLLLMRVEFFVPDWLKQRQILYIASHMVIIPLVDVYATGVDWKLEAALPSTGLFFFFAVSYLNGVVLEFGRKMRAPEQEEEGVVSYTGLYGAKGGVIIWLILLWLTLGCSLFAAAYAGYGWWGYSCLISFCLFATLPGVRFWQHATPARAKYVEYAAGAWTVAMYLTLGGVPMLRALLLS